MSNQEDRTLVEQILWNSSPTAFRGQTIEQIQTSIEELNNDWASEYTRFTKLQLSQAASDIELLANPTIEFDINDINYTFKQTKHPDGKDILIVSWAKNGVISFRWTSDCADLPENNEEALDLLVGCVWQAVTWRGRIEHSGQI